MDTIDIQTATDELPEPKLEVPYQVLQKMEGMGNVYWLNELTNTIMPRHRRGLYCLVDRTTDTPYSDGVKVGRIYVFERGEDGVYHKEFVEAAA